MIIVKEIGSTAPCRCWGRRRLRAHCAGISILLVKAALRERALPRRIKPLRRMTSHEFKIGEIVLLKPAIRRNVPDGSVKVTKQPFPHDDREFEYRIRSASGEHERVAGVSELTWAAA
jgi:hypothetical protein